MRAMLKVLAPRFYVVSHGTAKAKNGIEDMIHTISFQLLLDLDLI